MQLLMRVIISINPSKFSFSCKLHLQADIITSKMVLRISFHAIFSFEDVSQHLQDGSLYFFSFHLNYILQSARWNFVFLFSPYFLFEMQMAGWKIPSNRHAPPVSPMKRSSLCGASPCVLFEVSTTVHLNDSQYILMVQTGAQMSSRP